MDLDAFISDRGLQQWTLKLAGRSNSNSWQAWWKGRSAAAPANFTTPAAKWKAIRSRTGFRPSPRGSRAASLLPFIARYASKIHNPASKSPSRAMTLPLRFRLARSAKSAAYFRFAAFLTSLPFLLLPFLLLEVRWLFLSPSSRSRTAATINGKPTVASRKTSPNFPPSAGGTNLPQDTASLYGLPDNPPQYTGSGQIRNP